jgi:hypothetical protein
VEALIKRISKPFVLHVTGSFSDLRDKNLVLLVPHLGKHQCRILGDGPSLGISSK